MSSNTTKQTLSRRNHGNNTKETHEKKFFGTGGQKKLKFRCSNYTEKFGVKFFGGLKIAVVFFSKLAEKCTTFSTLLLPIDNFLHKKVFFQKLSRSRTPRKLRWNVRLACLLVHNNNGWPFFGSPNQDTVRILHTLFEKLNFLFSKKSVLTNLYFWTYLDFGVKIGRYS